MIQIIEQGKIDKQIATCPSCGTVFTFWQEDINEEFSFNEIFTSYASRPHFVKCPLCHMHIHEWKKYNDEQ